MFTSSVASPPNLPALVQNLTLKQKILRSKQLIQDAVDRFGDSLVVAHSLGKDSAAVWHLVKQISPSTRGFIVTTRYKPVATVEYMHRVVAEYPELRVFSNDAAMDSDLCHTDPDRCCRLLKVEPPQRALRVMAVRCWATGLRSTEGRTRTGFSEMEHRDAILVKLNPILLWTEREVWQYLALHRVDVNPLYLEGYRSLGCEPCTRITSDDNERAGRWVGTSKCGGECGIHTQPLMPNASELGKGVRS
jgi:phosphoadenosine phosphosulfate reductase